MIKTIITDIEGTTTDIQFVHKVLFPYSREHMTTFVHQHQQEPHIAIVLETVREQMSDPAASVADVAQQLIQWIDEDKKMGSLKTLQGYIWQQGFAQNQFKSHLYQDAYNNLIKWHQAGIQLYVYSSGSIQAQQLLFQYSIFGDLRYLFSGYFDTQVGGKKEALSYKHILNTLACEYYETLFLSDVIAELNAARENAIHTAWLNRYHSDEDNHQHQEFTSFDDINLAIFI